MTYTIFLNASLVLLLLLQIGTATCNNSYMILTPKIVRPGLSENITVTVLKRNVTASIKASLLDLKGNVLSDNTGLFQSHVPKALTLKIPENVNYSNNAASITHKIRCQGTSGLLFDTEAEVFVESRNITLFIQTDRGMYKGGQQVRVRTFGLHINSSIYIGNIALEITDPKSNIIKRWPQLQEPDFGVVSATLELDTEPVLGNWRVKATAQGTSRSVSFQVNEYVPPKFDLEINLPNTAPVSNTDITGSVMAKYTFGKPASGQLIITASISGLMLSVRDDGSKDLQIYSDHFHISKLRKFIIPFGHLRDRLLGPLLQGNINHLFNKRLKIDALFTEELTKVNVTKTAYVTLTKRNSLNLIMLNPNSSRYIPGMQYQLKVKVTANDGGSPSTLEFLNITLVSCSHTGQRQIEQQKIVPVPLNGNLNRTFDMPDNTDISNITLQVSCRDIKKLLILHPYDNSQVHVKLNVLSTVHTVGEKVKVEIQTNKPTQEVFFQFIARGLQILSGKHNTNNKRLSTLEVLLLPDMAPETSLIVYNADPNTAHIYADEVKITVHGLLLNFVSLNYSTSQAEPSDQIQLNVRTLPQSKVFLLAVDSSSILLGKNSDVTEQSVEENMSDFTPESQWKLFFYSRNCSYTRITHGNTYSAYRFEEAGTNLLTDVVKYDPFLYEYKTDFELHQEWFKWKPNNNDSCPAVTGPRYCVDGISNCNSYGPSVCDVSLYLEWLLENCAHYCNLCSRKDYVRPAIPYHGICYDKIQHCADYGQEVCQRSVSREWAKESCPLFCKICTAVMTDTGGTMTGTGGALTGTGGAMTGTGGAFTGTGDTGGSSTNTGIQPQGTTHTTQDNSRIYTDNSQIYIRSKFPETWLWTTENVGASGNATIPITVPDSITSWVTSAFSVNRISGLGVTDTVSKLTVFRPFFISIIMPLHVIQSEEVVLQVIVFNYLNENLTVLVSLEENRDFLNIVVDDLGYEHHEIISKSFSIQVCSGCYETVYFPIIPSTIGDVDVEVKAQSIIAADSVRRQLRVKPEGVLQERIEPLIVSVHNGSTFYHNTTIEFPPSVVKGSERVEVLVTGDYMVPSMMGLEKLVQLPTGCGEQTLVGLAPDVYIYEYLLNSGQLTDKWKWILVNYIEKGYQRELSFQNYDGSYRFWFNGVSSTWLTAFVLKCFAQAAKHVDINTEPLQKAQKWLIGHQRYDGNFNEQGPSILQNGHIGDKAIRISAFVLVTLAESSHIISNNESVAAVQKARRYLERNIQSMSDPYDAALSAYALLLSGSPLAASAMRKLEGFKQPWLSSGSDSSYPTASCTDIETASYALLYYGNTKQYSKAMNVAKWILKQRNSYGGFKSTQDTVIALQALSQLSVTGVFKSVDINAYTPTEGHHFLVRDSNKMVLQKFQPSTIPPFINISAHGEGDALIEVVVKFNEMERSEKPTFTLNISSSMETTEKIKVQVCASYNGTSVFSGMAIIEFGKPSGFDADLDKILGDGLKKKEEIDNKLALYFDHIKSQKTCLTLTLIRSSLVAKVKPSPVRVYEYYNPSNQFNGFFTPTVLQQSNYCDVCPKCKCAKHRR